MAFSPSSSGVASSCCPSSQAVQPAWQRLDENDRGKFLCCLCQAEIRGAGQRRPCTAAATAARCSAAAAGAPTHRAAAKQFKLIGGHRGGFMLCIPARLPAYVTCRIAGTCNGNAWPARARPLREALPLQCAVPRCLAGVAAWRLACSWPDERKPCKCSSCSEAARWPAAALLSRRAGVPVPAAAACVPSAEPPTLPAGCCAGASGRELLAVLHSAPLPSGPPWPASCRELPQLAALCQLESASVGRGSSAPLL